MNALSMLKLLLDWMEQSEEWAFVKTIVPKLRGGPTRAGALRWEEVGGEW